MLNIGDPNFDPTAIFESFKGYRGQRIGNSFTLSDVHDYINVGELGGIIDMDDNLKKAKILVSIWLAAQFICQNTSIRGLNNKFYYIKTKNK